MDRIGAGHDQTKDRVPAFVIGDAFAIGIAQDDRPFRPEHDLLQSIDKIAVVDLVLLPARSEQGRLIDQVLDVRPGRSEERRGGKGGVSTCRSWWSPYH